MSTHKVSERGQGFPAVGERVFNAQDNEVCIVESIDSGILTKQFEADYILATLAYDCDPCDLGETEFNDLRVLRIEPWRE